jgi:hypothetical protein
LGHVSARSGFLRRRDRVFEIEDEGIGAGFAPPRKLALGIAGNKQERA